MNVNCVKMGMLTIGCMVSLVSVAHLSFVSDYQYFISNVGRSIGSQREYNVVSGSMQFQLQEDDTDIKATLVMSAVANEQQDVYTKMNVAVGVQSMEDDQTAGGDLEMIMINDTSDVYLRVDNISGSLMQDEEMQMIISGAQGNRYQIGSLMDEMNGLAGGITNPQISKMYQEQLIALLAKYPLIKPLGQRSDMGVYMVSLDRSNMTKLTAEVAQVLDPSLSAETLNQMRMKTFNDLRRVSSAGSFDTVQQSVEVAIGDQEESITTLKLQPGVIMATIGEVAIDVQWTGNTTSVNISADDEYTNFSLKGLFHQSKQEDVVVQAPEDATNLFELFMSDYDYDYSDNYNYDDQDMNVAVSDVIDDAEIKQDVTVTNYPARPSYLYPQVK